MMPHPHAVCEFAAMDHQERQARARQDRLAAQVRSGANVRKGWSRALPRQLGAALVRVGERLQGVPREAPPVVGSSPAR